METTATVKITVLVVLVLKHTAQHNEFEADSRRIRSTIRSKRSRGWSTVILKERTISKCGRSCKELLKPQCFIVSSSWESLLDHGLLLNGKLSTLEPHQACHSFMTNTLRSFELDLWIWIA